MRNNINGFICDVFTYPCSDTYGDLTKPLLKLAVMINRMHCFAVDLTPLSDPGASFASFSLKRVQAKK